MTEENITYPFIHKPRPDNWYYCIEADNPILPSQVPNSLCCNWLSYSVREWRIEVYKSARDYAGLTDIDTGKWMIFPRDVDDLWPRLIAATSNSSLGIGIKASTPYKKRNSLICVYTCDELDKEDTDRVYDALRALGVGGRLNYKPDWYTYAGIHGSTWTALPGERPHRPNGYRELRRSDYFPQKEMDMD